MARGVGDMCILCSLNRKDRDGEIAKSHCDQIIELCVQLKNDYVAIKVGRIKPHTKEMKSVILTEKALARILLEDVL